MRSLFALLLLPSLSVSAPAIIAKQSSDIQITSVTTSGSGCPAGSVSSTISPDGSVITLGFDSYETLVGPGASSADREEDCEIFLNLFYPIGCTAATFNATYHGFAQLDSGVTGSLSADYILSPGSTGSEPPTAVISGSAFTDGGVYEKDDTVTTETTINTTNQQNVSFVVRTRLSLQAMNATVSGTLTDDDATISIASQSSC